MSEMRFDPIKRSWVIIATERGMRPSFAPRREEARPEETSATCPFCPGNEPRTPPEIMAFRDGGGAPNGPGWRVRVIPNKFPALAIESPLQRRGQGIYDVVTGFGAHEIIVETPRHDWQMGDFTLDELTDVFLAYRERLADLSRDERFRYIMIFKNHGADAGATLEHAHSQIIALPVTPNAIVTELASARDHFSRKERCIICDLMSQELLEGSRVVYQDEKFLVYSPFAAHFPFELMIAPRVHAHDYARTDTETVRHFASVVKETLRRLDRVLGDPPFNFVLHTAPPSYRRPGKPEYWGSIERDYHWHLELVPRLTKIAGFEWGTGFYINPTCPEDAAAFLRDAEP